MTKHNVAKGHSKPISAYDHDADDDLFEDKLRRVVASSVRTLASVRSLIDSVIDALTVKPKSRQLVCGTESVMVEPGKSATVGSSPQVRTFTVRRIVLTKEVAESFDITDIIVGKDSQLAAYSPKGVDGIAFTVGAGDSGLSLDTCLLGQAISFRVKNKSDKPMSFNAAMFGDATE